MRKRIAAFFCCLLIGSTLSTGAYARELLVGGQAVGIQAATAGVLVAGLTKVDTGGSSFSPAESAGIKKGDLIIALGGKVVKTASELIDAVTALEGRNVELTLRREGKTLRINVQPIRSREGQWMMGMWLRDGVTGIGTLTFCDPESGIYGALGHGINDAESGSELPLAGGSITEAEIVSVTPGTPGQPGELNGCADMGRVLGSIEGNTDHGIYGKANKPLGSGSLEIGQIDTGSASIVSTVSGRQAEEYEVEINRLYHDAEGVHVMLTVTDPRLTALTGGIVQGMSGSPIIQNGKLVGAVTHVFVNDPTRGYGVSIQDMLHSAGLGAEARAA